MSKLKFMEKIFKLVWINNLASNIYIKENVEGITRGIVKVAIVLENLATLSVANRPKELLSKDIWRGIRQSSLD